MNASISKSEITGKVIAPPSKSYTIRGMMCAALSRGKSKILYPLNSDDTQAALNVLSKVGVNINQKEASWQVKGGDFHEPNTDLFCGESAATLRFMTAICSLIPGKCHLTAGPSLSQRPVKPLIQALRQLGVNCRCHGEVAPVTVEGSRLKGGVTELPGNVSSQFVSALLLIAPFADEGIRIRLTTPLESKSFVLMTLECLKKFGVNVECSHDFREFNVLKQTYKPASYKVEGDWSSASYFLALGATCGEMAVENLEPESLQGDKVILDLLNSMGAIVNINKNSVTVRRSKLNGIKADLSNCIDLLPTMAVLAAASDGVSELSGIERARLKESDRVSALSEGLGRTGIEIKEERNKLTITGSELKSSIIDSKDDHRIAMAFSILGSLAGGITINNAECVSKTFPQFWDILKSIGGEVKIDG